MNIQQPDKVDNSATTTAALVRYFNFMTTLSYLTRLTSRQV